MTRSHSTGHSMSDIPTEIREFDHSLVPCLVVPDGAAAVEFYQSAFDAVELSRHTDDDGRVTRAELRVGGSPVRIREERNEELEPGSPAMTGGEAVTVNLYARNADELLARAVDAGAILLLPMREEAPGERIGGLIDPFGHIWYLSTHVAPPRRSI